MSFLRFLATNIYSERINGAEQNATIKNAFLQAVASTNNQTVVAGVAASGNIPAKKIRVLNLVAHSVNNAAGRIVFKSASGGTNLRSYHLITPTGAVADINVYDQDDLAGIMESVTAGEGIFVDNNVADIVNISVRYIEFVP